MNCKPKQAQRGAKDGAKDGAASGLTVLTSPAPASDPDKDKLRHKVAKLTLEVKDLRAQLATASSATTTAATAGAPARTSVILSSAAATAAPQPGAGEEVVALRAQMAALNRQLQAQTSANATAQAASVKRVRELTEVRGRVPMLMPMCNAVVPMLMPCCVVGC